MAPPIPKSLVVSENGRYLSYPDGTPFFYLGDTAWELFHRLNREEADRYLEDRAQKGFTVIQAVVLAELDGLHTPNPYGHTPLIDDDPLHPNVAYFEHVDYIVDKAEELGLFIGMLPTWGDKFHLKWGVGPEIFTPLNARVFGEFLGERYKNRSIIWILGGDRNPENAEDLAIIREMAKGLEAGDGGRHLMTYHPQGGSNSATWFQEDEWLDFNMFQSGHSAENLPNYRMNWENFARTPVKPTLDGEPRYEDHPVNWKPENGWFGPFDVRQAAWWGALSGACGHTYGNHNIWQMWQPGRKPVSSARTPWQQALEHMASTQVGYMRKLLNARPWYELIPDSEILVGDTTSGGARIISALARDSSFILAYTPKGQPVSIDSIWYKNREVEAWWFDPRSGKSTIAQASAGVQVNTYLPPNAESQRDWVLVLDDAARGLKQPEI